MILGTGVDIVSIGRIRNIVRDEGGGAFCEKTYTGRELSLIEESDHPDERYASHFAGKEAVFKSLGLSAEIRFFWRDIEIIYRECGQPEAVLHGEIEKQAIKRGAGEIHLSLSYEGDTAQAFAICEKIN